MLFGRRKPGFVKETAEELEKAEEKLEESKDLLSYLESLPEAEEDEFAGLEPEAEAVPEEHEEQELTEAQKLAEYIRIRTHGTQLTAYQALAAEIENLDELLVELSQDETCADIVSVKGKKDRYYYSGSSMSDNYAMIASLVEEKNLTVTIAEMVRFNCKTYPAPTPFTYFERSPYAATKAQISRAIDVLGQQPENADIQVFTNNVGQKFFYSTELMSLKYAKALADVEEYTD